MRTLIFLFAFLILFSKSFAVEKESSFNYKDVRLASLPYFQIDTTKVDTTKVDSLKTAGTIVTSSGIDTLKTQTTFVGTTAAVAFMVNTTAIDTVSVDSVETDTLAAGNVAVADTTTVKEEKINYWTKINRMGINLNEVAFVNWNSGGNNSFSALFHMNFARNYKRDLLAFSSNVALKYGINAQEGREVRKTEDQIEINSNFGYRRDTISNWYYSGKLNFNTQFTFGFRYPNTDDPISKFMAPGYLFLGVGTEFSHPTEDFTAYISPVTQKSTFVLDTELANEGMFGVAPAVRDEEGNIIEEGERIRSEFGFLLSSSFSKQIFTNIGMSNQIRLYSDYLNKFGNVDVDWEVNFSLRVNEYVQANIGSHIKYDDDVKIKEDRDGDGVLETGGARVQFKQLLGVGLVYQF